MSRIQRSEYLRFPLEPRKVILVGCHRRGHYFDRDRTFQVRVDGAIHLAHSAFTDLCRDFIGPEPSAGIENHASWKTSRYREPEARLAYVRRAYRRWTRPPRE